MTSVTGYGIWKVFQSIIPAASYFWCHQGRNLTLIREWLQVPWQAWLMVNRDKWEQFHQWLLRAWHFSSYMLQYLFSETIPMTIRSHPCLTWLKKKKRKKSISRSVAKCQSKIMFTSLYAKELSLPAGSITEWQHLVSHCWLHVPNTPLWLTAQGHQHILFIEALTWDLLFPLTEEAWTLIKHLMLRTCVQQWKSSRKKAIKRETQRRIGKLSVPFSKKNIRCNQETTPWNC